jgi:hypothetical protein
MTRTVTFAPPLGLGEEPRLPWNYLPAALPAIVGDPAATGRLLIAVRHGLEMRETVSYFAVGTDTLADPLRMTAFMATARGRVAGPDAKAPISHWFVGAPTSLPETGDPLTLPMKSNPANVPANATRAAVIIDGGIAFWNHSFRIAGNEPLFREIAYLDFDAPMTGKPVDQRLEASEIAKLFELEHKQGEHAVMHELGRRFPGSVFGPGGTAWPDRLWHGTAVADLVAGGAAGDLALYGIELPMAVLSDHCGDALTAHLAVALEVALAMTAALAGRPRVIVLPFGFVSGPQDGSHPAARAIAQVLAQAGPKVKLVVPAGNHLQDRCTARIDAEEARPLVWRTAPDDFSPNVVQMVVEHAGGAAPPPVVTLTPPGGAPEAIPLQPGLHRPLTVDGHVVGSVQCTVDTPTRAQLRVALMGSGWGDASAVPAPAGDWQIAVQGHTVAHVHVLRDDRDRSADRARPRSPSSLHDAAYRETDLTGAHLLNDPGGEELVLRAWTASVLTTAPGVVAVAAQERRTGEPAMAWYSGLPADGMQFDKAELVDDGGSLRGLDCAANGSGQRGRLSGTSAAAALFARRELELGYRPPG